MSGPCFICFVRVHEDTYAHGLMLYTFPNYLQVAVTTWSLHRAAVKACCGFLVRYYGVWDLKPPVILQYKSGALDALFIDFFGLEKKSLSFLAFFIVFIELF